MATNTPALLDTLDTASVARMKLRGIRVRTFMGFKMTDHRGRRALQIDPQVRAFLIAETFRFIHAVRSMTGIEKIALVGSLATEKPDPKDTDILVTVADDLDLTALASESRKLKGRAQTKNRGADIFLANPAGQYIGRICHWRECAPGIRMSCDARHCGGRKYLHDDLDAISLNARLIREPPIQIWPRVEHSGDVPADVVPCLYQLQQASPDEMQ